MTSIEADDTLFQILNASAQLKAALSGRIYVNERPDDSTKEDIVINCLALSQLRPQFGTSNINIHVPDKTIKICGKEQKVTNRERLRLLTDLVLGLLNTANVNGLTIEVTSDNIINETEISQHYNNLRLDWNIHLKD